MIIKKEILNPGSEEPISLEMAKKQCRILDDDPGNLDFYRSAARARAEDYTDKVYRERLIEAKILKNDIEVSYPLGLHMKLSRPVKSIISAKLTKVDGTVDQVVIDDCFEFSEGSKIVVIKSCYIYSEIESIDLEFISLDKIRETELQAMLLLVAHYNENRQEASPENLKEIPAGAKSLLMAEYHGAFI